jgi:Amt family ammonium transporter
MTSPGGTDRGDDRGDLGNVDYIVQIPYNGTGDEGANPLEFDVNIWYRPGDIAWVIAATFLVLLMVPGVG